MLSRLKRLVVIAIILCISLGTSRPARADIAYTHDGKAIGVIVAVVAVAAVIGFGVYYAVHHGHSLKGCTAASPAGLQLRQDASQDPYLLTGEIQGIKAGERVHVSGSKTRDRSKGKTFVVTRLSKDYGACRTP